MSYDQCNVDESSYLGNKESSKTRTASLAKGDPRPDEVVVEATGTPGRNISLEEWRAMVEEERMFRNILVPLPDGTDADPGNPYVIATYGDKLPMKLDRPLTGPDSKWETWYDPICKSS